MIASALRSSVGRITKNWAQFSAPAVQHAVSTLLSPSRTHSVMAASSETQPATAASPIIIDGKATAKDIRGELKQRVTTMKEACGKVPGLAVVLVGDRRDSATYVRMKTKACEEVGITSVQHDLAAETSQADLMKLVAELNADDSVHGILVQLPLPGHINEHEVLESINVTKDVDGLHPTNMAFLAMRGRDPLFAPCTPSGCIELLKRYNIPIQGKRAAVLGRSNIVGIPAGLLLMANDATVTMCHRYTPDMKAVLQEADIVVVAIGKAEHVPGDWIKPGATVIDVGINSVDDPSAKRGYRLVGDVHYESASKVAGAITPVPGGVGPMTIAMLLRNTVDSAVRAYGIQE